MTAAAATAARLLDPAHVRAIAAGARAAGGRRGPARIAVIGEFNSGKTTVVNVLVGAPVLPASAVHHTPCPVVIGHAGTAALTARTAAGGRVAVARHLIDQLAPADATRLDLRLPLATLRGLRIVDTPGLGLGAPDEEQTLASACRSADLIVWCTPAFQAWKHSERVLWLKLPEPVRRRGVLAVTFCDAVADAVDLDRLLVRLQTDAGPHFRDIVLTGRLPECAFRFD